MGKHFLLEFIIVVEEVVAASVAFVHVTFLILSADENLGLRRFPVFPLFGFPASQKTTEKVPAFK